MRSYRSVLVCSWYGVVTMLHMLGFSYQVCSVVAITENSVCQSSSLLRFLLVTCICCSYLCLIQLLILLLLLSQQLYYLVYLFANQSSLKMITKAKSKRFLASSLLALVAAIASAHAEYAGGINPLCEAWPIPLLKIFSR